ncbi:MAG: serine/threonine-protein kinase [Anaerolineales bacterium]
MPGLIGESLDRYRLAEQIGQGGMATVYRATDPRTGKECAVKVLSPTIGSDKRFVRRFRREAEVLARLKHPQIVPVLDYGQARGMVYLVMPFVAGETMHQKLVKRKFTETEVRRWIRQVADALQFAHDAGIIHRDIKPSNIMIDRDGNAFLTDFGLARLAEGSGTLTGSLLMGTPAYVSPEQGRGELVDARSDQYSFGVILFQLVTGQLPFDGDTPMATVMQHLQEPPPPPRTINPKLPPAAEKVILKSLAKDPSVRFASVGETVKAFEAALDGASERELGLDKETILRTIAARPAAARPQPAPSPRRRSAWLFLGLVPLAALGAVIALPALTRGAVTPLAPTSVGIVAAASATARPTDVPVPSATPFVATSDACPGVSMSAFEVSTNEVRWMIDNNTTRDITLVELPGLEVPPPGPVEIRLGDVVLWSGVFGEGSQTWIAGTDRTIPANGTRRLIFRYALGPLDPRGYFVDAAFSSGCNIAHDW